MFTIDSDNNIAAFAGCPASTENVETFAAEKELAKLAAETGNPQQRDCTAP